MPKHLSSLLLCLLLLVAACSKKKDPEPEPKLEGTWTVHHTEETRYADDNTVVATTTVTPVQPTTYIFTATELNVQESGRPHTTYTYTREQSILHCQDIRSLYPTDMLIQSLTKSELVLEQWSGRVPGLGYIRSVTRLTR